MQILKVIGLLMEYPDELLWECKDDALALIRRDAPMLTDFALDLLNAPLLDKQAEWCEVFDRGRTTSLLLFEHVHAESRDRGQAMVDLLAEYEKVGLQLDCRELPDYLPLYLEYLSVLPDDQAKEGLLNVAPILALLGGRLKQREAPWYFNKSTYQGDVFWCRYPDPHHFVNSVHSWVNHHSLFSTTSRRQ